MKQTDEHNLNGQTEANGSLDLRATVPAFPQADSSTDVAANVGKRIYRAARHAVAQKGVFLVQANDNGMDIAYASSAWVASAQSEPYRASYITGETEPSSPIATGYTNGFTPYTDDFSTPQKGGGTATFAFKEVNPPFAMANNRDVNNIYSQPDSTQPKPEQSVPYGVRSAVQRKPLAPPSAIDAGTPPAVAEGDHSALPGASTELSSNGIHNDPAADDVPNTAAAIPCIQAIPHSEYSVQPASDAFLRPTQGLPKKIPRRQLGTVPNDLGGMPAPTSADPLTGSYAASGDLNDPYTYEWQELLAALKHNRVFADQPRTPGVEDFVTFDSHEESAYQNTADNPALLPDEPLAYEPSSITDPMVHPSKTVKLTPKDFSVAFGRSHPDGQGVHQEVANAFARAWAEDETAIKYDGAYHIEADAPPTKDSRAASGWMPGDPEEPAVTSVPFASIARNMVYTDDENQLFEAYGASYAEAYAVALELEFSEEKPVPDDNTGDVTGLTSSILHTPSGKPILLGTVMLEDQSDNAPSMDSTEHAADGSVNGGEPPLSLGRKVVRYLLMGLGAATVAVAALYFAGLLL